MAPLSKDEIEYLRDVVHRDLERVKTEGHAIDEPITGIAGVEKAEGFLGRLLRKLEVIAGPAKRKAKGS